MSGQLRSDQEVFQSSRVGSGRVGSGRVGSGRVGSGRVGSGRVGSGRVGSGRVGSGRVGSGRVGSVHEVFRSRGSGLDTLIRPAESPGQSRKLFAPQKCHHRRTAAPLHRRSMQQLSMTQHFSRI